MSGFHSFKVSAAHLYPNILVKSSPSLSWSTRNAVRYGLIITVFAGFQIHFVKYIQVIGVLYGYNKFGYVDQCVKQTLFVLMKWNLNTCISHAIPPKTPLSAGNRRKRVFIGFSFFARAIVASETRLRIYTSDNVLFKCWSY